MMTLKICQNKQDWDDYVLENGGHPLQLWGWGDVKFAHGWTADRLFLYDEEGDEVIGAVQLLVRRLPLPMRSLAYVPRGPVVAEENREALLSALAEYVKRVHRSVAITIEPDETEYTIPKGWRHSKNHILPTRTILLDLNTPEAELLTTMEPNTRRYIRRSAEQNLVIKKVINREELDAVLTVYRDTAKRAKFSLHHERYYHDVFNKLDDSSVLFVALSDSKPVAFLWLAVSARTAFELYGGMTEEGRKLHASYALKWHAIRKSKEWGLERYDFGGLVEGGVTAFKKGWSTEETKFVGTLDLPLSASYGIWNSGLPLAKSVIRPLKNYLDAKPQPVLVIDKLGNTSRSKGSVGLFFCA